MIDHVLLARLSECEPVDRERVAQHLEPVEFTAQGSASTWRSTLALPG